VLGFNPTITFMPVISGLGFREERRGWRVEGGEWRVESGGWSVESGVWRVEGGWRVRGLPDDHIHADHFEEGVEVRAQLAPARDQTL